MATKKRKPAKRKTTARKPARAKNGRFKKR